MSETPAPSGPIAYIGDFRANGLMLARYLHDDRGWPLKMLLRKGFDEVWLQNTGFGEAHNLDWADWYPWPVDNFLSWPVVWSRLKRLTADSRLVLARSGGGIPAMFLKKPYLIQTVGSDVGALPLLNSTRSKLITTSLKRARMILCSQLRHGHIIHRMGLDYLNLPLPVWRGEAGSSDIPERPAGFDLVLFSCTQFHWRGPRSVTKGNDTLLKAFARFVGQGHKACLMVVEHGEDAHLARGLVRELGLEENVIFVGTRLPQGELTKYFTMADAVIDQFAIGEAGLSCLDAMALGKAVVVYIDNRLAEPFYGGDLPPVVNARTEDAILTGLERLMDPSFRDNLGAQANLWWRRNHHPGVVADRLAEIMGAVA